MTRPSIDARKFGRVSRLMVVAISLAALLQLTGCTQMQMGQPMATIENVAKIRGTGLAPVEVGRFTADSANDPRLDVDVSIRINVLRSPIEGSFAQYLRETLKVELASAGLLKPDAEAVITGVLFDSAVSAPVGTGKASLGSRFVVTRAGFVRYDKKLEVTATWDSPFIGVSAILQAAGQYEALYRKLVGMLLADPAFLAAISSPQTSSSTM
jgi:hypothetical protein